MKSKINTILLSASLLMSGLPAFAQESDTASESSASRSAAVRISPLVLTIGMIHVNGDFVVGEKFTVGPKISFLNRTFGDTSMRVFSIGAQSRFFLSGNVLEDSWFLSPSILRSNLKVSNTAGDEASVSSWALNATGGYNWAWPSGFSMSLEAGVAIATAPKTVTDGDGNEIEIPKTQGTSRVSPAFDFEIGWAF